MAYAATSNASGENVTTVQVHVEARERTELEELISLAPAQCSVTFVNFYPADLLLGVAGVLARPSGNATVEETLPPPRRFVRGFPVLSEEQLEEMDSPRPSSE